MSKRSFWSSFEQESLRRLKDGSMCSRCLLWSSFQVFGILVSENGSKWKFQTRNEFLYIEFWSGSINVTFKVLEKIFYEMDQKDLLEQTQVGSKWHFSTWRAFHEEISRCIKISFMTGKVDQNIFPLVKYFWTHSYVWNADQAFGRAEYFVIQEHLFHQVLGIFYGAFFWQTFFQKIHFSNWNQFLEQHHRNSSRFLLSYLLVSLWKDDVIEWRHHYVMKWRHHYIIEWRHHYVMEWRHHYIIEWRHHYIMEWRHHRLKTVTYYFIISNPNSLAPMKNVSVWSSDFEASDWIKFDFEVDGWSRASSHSIFTASIWFTVTSLDMTSSLEMTSFGMVSIAMTSSATDVSVTTSSVITSPVMTSPVMTSSAISTLTSSDS